MRVLHVNDQPAGYGHGGAEVYLDRLAAAQRLRGDTVEHLHAQPRRHAVERLRDLWDPAALRQLRDRVAAFAPDVVHLHNVVRELSPSVLRPTGVATVMTVHDRRWLDATEHSLPDPRAVADRLWVGPAMRRGARQLSGMVGVSDAITRELVRLRLPSPRTVPAPVPAPLVETRPPSACHDVVFVGRMSREKGVHVLVDAFAEVASTEPEARLVLVGDGPERPRLAEGPVPPWLLLTGRVGPEEVSRALGQARVVAVPSVAPEGLPLVGVEAARHGRPLVVSDDAGLRELAGVVGADVVPPGDVGELAARLAAWLGDPEGADAAGRVAAVGAARHDPAAVAEAMASVYAAARGEV